MKIEHGPTESGGYTLRFDGEINLWITGVMMLLPMDPLRCWVAESLDKMVRIHQISEDAAVMGFTLVMDYAAARAKDDSAKAEKLEVVG